MPHTQPRTVLVTGAAQGIGRSVATKMNALGDRVILVDRDEEQLRETARSLGRGTVTRVADISRRAEVVDLFDGVRDDFSGLDVLINNAGVTHRDPFVNSDPRDWSRVFDVNVFGLLTVTQLALPMLRTSASGRVVNVASEAGITGTANQAVYSASKAAVIGFTKALARELARNAITVNSVCPGPTTTAMMDDLVAGNPSMTNSLVSAIPMARFAEPDEVADTIVFLASAGASYITGQAISVSGGLTMR